jgi:hypothetical protein
MNTVMNLRIHKDGKFLDQLRVILASQERCAMELISKACRPTTNLQQTPDLLA